MFGFIKGVVGGYGVTPYKEFENDLKGLGSTPNNSNFYSKMIGIFLFNPNEGQSGIVADMLGNINGATIERGTLNNNLIGVSGNGGINTNYNIGLNESVNNIGFTMNVTTNIPGGIDLGCINGSSLVWLDFDDATYTGVIGSYGDRISHPAGIGNRTINSNGNLEMIINGQLVGSKVHSGTPLPNSYLGIMCRYNAGTGLIEKQSLNNTTFAAIHKYLTPLETADLHFAIDKLNAAVRV